MPALDTRPLFDLTLEIGKPIDLRHADGLGRTIVHVTGGRFEGERLRGRVLPVSGDWIRNERGFARIDVRLALETDAGEHVFMRYEGTNTLTAEHRAQLAAGETPDAASYYFRTAAFFETAAPGLDWLNRVVAVGVGQRTADAVRYEVLELL